MHSKDLEVSQLVGIQRAAVGLHAKPTVLSESFNVRKELTCLLTAKLALVLRSLGPRNDWLQSMRQQKSKPLWD